MESSNNGEYHYEMVVNIVAEMVVEYLKTTDCDTGTDNTGIVTCGENEGKQDEPEKAA